MLLGVSKLYKNLVAEPLYHNLSFPYMFSLHNIAMHVWVKYKLNCIAGGFTNDVNAAMDAIHMYIH